MITLELLPRRRRRAEGSVAPSSSPSAVPAVAPLLLPIALAVLGDAEAKFAALLFFLRAIVGSIAINENAAVITATAIGSFNLMRCAASPL